jgi:hypothetical protein
MTPDIILGPPGCGKTETLLSEVERLLKEGLEPEEICFVTFTKRAAREAVVRAAEKFGFGEERFRWFRTLHSLCFRCGDYSRGDVLAGRALEEFADWCGVEFTPHRSTTWLEGWQGPRMGDRIMHLENLARVSGKELQEVYDTTEHDLPWSEVRRVAADLETFKSARGMVDYTDMLTNFTLGAPARLGIRALLVDEAQDLSVLQWAVVVRLAETHTLVSFVVAGDDDQAIYEWAGAAVEDFIKLPGQARVLSQSWRVPSEVQKIAGEVIGRVDNRRPKDWKARPETGEVVRAVGFDEVDIEEGAGETLILARNHIWLERDVAPVLRREGVYFSISGEPSVSGETLAAVRGWELWRRGEQIPAELARTLQLWLPPENRGREVTGEEDLVSAMNLGIQAQTPWHVALTRMPVDEVAYILAMRTRGETLQGVPRVRLSTIHGSKGGQADHVVVLTDMSSRSFKDYEREPDQETRVWYVAVTRARQRLTIVDRPDAPKYFSL